MENQIELCLFGVKVILSVFASSGERPLKECVRYSMFSVNSGNRVFECETCPKFFLFKNNISEEVRISQGNYRAICIDKIATRWVVERYVSVPCSDAKDVPRKDLTPALYFLLRDGSIFNLA